MKIIKIAQIQQELQMTPYAGWLAKEIQRLTKDYTIPLENALRFDLESEDFKLITEWINNTKPNLEKLTLDEAYQEAFDWDAKNNYATNNIIYEFNDGWKVVQLSYEDIPSEAALMTPHYEDAPYGNLNETTYSENEEIGSLFKPWEDSNKDYTKEKVKNNEYIIYSLRDPNNNPKATIEIEKDKNDLRILQIFSREEPLEEKKSQYWSEYHHPYEQKVKEFIEWLKTQGNVAPLDSDEDIDITNISDAELENEFGIPLSFSKIGGDADDYYQNLTDAFSLGNSGSYWYKGSPEKAVDALIEHAKLVGELPELQKALEGFATTKYNKKGEKYTAYQSLNNWADDAWFENELYIDFENPRPEEEDYPDKEDYMTYPDPNQQVLPGIPPPQPKLDEEAYNKALKKYQEAEEAYEEELTQHQEYFEPYQFTKYVWDQVQRAIGEKEKNKEIIKEQKIKTKIYKMAEETKENEIPTPDILATYVESLKMYKENNLSIKEEYSKLIENLPSPRKIRQDFSNEECKILYETVEYLWRKITGKKIIQEAEIINPPESLFGNYWLIKNGILLEGPNHYTIIKQNPNLISTLLNINGMTLQEKLARRPNKVIEFILKNGGIRLFINKDKKLYAQMSSETYGKFGKQKIKKYDFHSKAIKLVDFKTPFKGWESGISIKL